MEYHNKKQLQNEVDNSLRIIKEGGIILYPTDTIWGIGCDATNDKAVERIFELKKRAANKSMILLLDTSDRLLRYVKDIPEQAFQLIDYSDKPLTIIYENGLNVSKRVLGDDHSVAIRITKDDFCKQLIYKLQRPLVSTSANISGQLSPANFSEIDPEVLKGVDYVVNLRQNESAKGQPSVIMKLKLNGTIEFIRK